MNTGPPLSLHQSQKLLPFQFLVLFMALTGSQGAGSPGNVLEFKPMCVAEVMPTPCRVVVQAGTSPNHETTTREVTFPPEDSLAVRGICLDVRRRFLKILRVNIGFRARGRQGPLGTFARRTTRPRRRESNGPGPFARSRQTRRLRWQRQHGPARGRLGR